MTEKSLENRVDGMTDRQTDRRTRRKPIVPSGFTGRGLKKRTIKCKKSLRK